MNWRDLMAAPPEILTSPQNTQNTQNGEARGIIAHSANIAYRVVAERVALVSALPTQTGEGSPLPMPFPTPPLQSGWRIVYRDHQWKLAGGHDDPDHGTVKACHWIAGAWTVHLTDGQRLPLAVIRSVGKTDGEGKLVGAWTVREHGYDGLSQGCGGMDYGDSKSSRLALLS